MPTLSNPQVEMPDIGASIARGFNMGQTARINNLQVQEFENKQELARYTNGLMRLAAAGDNAAQAELSARNPEAAKGLRDQQSYLEAQGVKHLDGFLNGLPAMERGQEAYDAMKSSFKAATGKDAQLPLKYSPEAERDMRQKLAVLKGREQQLKEEKMYGEVGETKARTGLIGAQTKTEGFQQRKIESDIQKNAYDMAKQAREEARTQGGYDPELARKVDADLIKTTSEAATGARNGLTSLNQLEALLKDKDTSKTKAVGAAISQYVPGLSSLNSKNVADYQASQALTTKLATEALKMMGGNDSNTDVKLQMSAAPSFDKPWATNKVLINNQKAGLKMAAQIPTFIGEWRRANGSTINPDRKTGQTYQEAFNEWQAKKYEQFGGEYTVKADQAQQQVKQPSSQQSQAPDGTVIRGKDGRTFQKTGGQWRAI